MITIDYFGRAGNVLCQYVFARILCIQYSDGIYTPEPKLLLPLVYGGHPVPKSLVCGQTKMINDYNSVEFMDKQQDLGDVTHLHLHGYFQKSWFYNSYRDLIKKMFDLPVIQKNCDDIVIHLRLTDYFWSKVNSVVSPEWYTGIICGQKYRKCYIVVEDHPTNKKYLPYLTHSIKNAEVVTGGSAIDDFNFIRNFDRIVCSNSTFAWWAAFLSDATKVWTFSPWLYKNGTPDLSGMVGAQVVPGKFYHDRELAAMNWGEYWNK